MAGWERGTIRRDISEMESVDSRWQEAKDKITFLARNLRVCLCSDCVCTCMSIDMSVTDMHACM